MNTTNSTLPDFGTDEVFDVVVRHNSSHHDYATPITAHRINGFTTNEARSRACRTWPSAQGKVYVVDSYPGLAQLAKTILELEGFRTCAFESRAHAWQAFAFAQPRPVVLITDNLDGDAPAMELIRRCRSVEPMLRTLLVDQHRTFPDPNLVDGLLALPYCGPLLVQEVRRLCSRPSGAMRTKLENNWLAA